MKRVPFAALLLAFSVSAVTVQAADSGFYLGVSAGKSKLKDACSVTLQADFSCDDNDQAFGVFGGYQISKHLAVEVAYTDLGESDVSGGVIDSPTLSSKLTIKGAEVSALFFLPIGQNTDLFGRVGAFHWDSEQTSDVPEIAAVNSTGTNTTFGAGVRYRGTNSPIDIRLQWQRYDDISGVDVDSITAGIAYRF
jgi:OOP family OmpA-OmpF porin